MSTINLTYGQPTYIAAGTTFTGINCNYVGYDEASTINYTVCSDLQWHHLMAKPKQEQKNMFYNNINIETDTLEGKQKQYLLTRASQIASEKDKELEKKFGLLSEHPKTIKEVIARIKSGEFKLKEKYENEDPYDFYDDDDDVGGGLMGAIDWRKTPEDREGYRAAHVILEAELTKARDGIVVAGDAAAALAILEKFEGTKH